MIADKTNMTVTMSMTDYEYYQEAVKSRDKYVKILERANVDGKAVLTEELIMAIKEIFD
mgnify:CR=1 FL=1